MKRYVFAMLWLASTALADDTLYYRGVIKLKNEAKPRPVCLAVSPNVTDRNHGDVDLFPDLYQPILRMTETTPDGVKVCESTIEFNGNYIRTCSGMYLVGERFEPNAAILGGDVFTDLARYDRNGNLVLPPIGEFALTAETGDCGK